MRIRKISMNSASLVPTSTTSSPSSSSSPCLHSSISAHSIASSTDSSFTSWPSNSSSRCEGLDLLVKAIHQVSEGSVVGVPYVQRRVVIRRRRRAQRFNQFVVAQSFKNETGGEVVDEAPRELEVEDGIKSISMLKRRQRRVMALPSKYQDSVLQPWRPRTGSRRSIKIER